MKARRKPAPVETTVSNQVAQYTHLASACPSEKGRATWARLARQARQDAGLAGGVQTRKRGTK
jgi:hypothetical protein